MPSKPTKPTKHAGLLGNQPKKRKTVRAADPIKTLRAELARVLRISITTPPLTYRQFLEERIVIPDGPHAGKPFKIHRQPVVGLWADAIDSGKFNEFVFTAPSQFGKTLAAFVGPILWHTCELDDNTVMGVPHADMASDKWRMDIEPAMRASHHLSPLRPISGSGSAGGKIRELVTFSNGVALKPMSAGGSDTAKAGFTSRVIVVTEAAGFSDSSETSVEADPLRQIRARQRAYKERDKATYIEGTLTVEHELPWSLKEQSTQSVIMSKCPHCGVHVHPEREDLVGWQDARTEMEARTLAYWQCPECLEAITEAQRAKMLLESKLVHRGQTINDDGTIVGPMPETSRLWFHAKAFHNLFLEAGDIGKTEWMCRQIAEDTLDRYSAEKELAQFVHARPYVSPLFANELELDSREIGQRRYELPPGILPADTETLTLGVDVGQKECWYLFLARRRDKDGNVYWHIPAYGKVDVPSDRMPVGKAIKKALAEIHRMAQAGFAVEGSSVIRKPDQEWYDSRHKGDDVLQFIAEVNATEYADLTLSQRKWQPVVGAFGCGSTMIGSANYTLPKKTGNEVRDLDTAGLWYTARIARSKTYAVFWDADTSKREVQHSLTLRTFLNGAAEQTPGSTTLYAGTARIHERITRHWTNEKLIKDSLTGKMKWKRTGANHLLDCYAMARRAMDRADHCREKLGVYAPVVTITKTPKTTKRISQAQPLRDLPAPPSQPPKSGQGWYDR